MMHAMPDDWQKRMAVLLNEYDDFYPNQPDIGTRVQITDLSGKLISTPEYLINYRHPRMYEIEQMKGSKS